MRKTRTATEHHGTKGGGESFLKEMVLQLRLLSTVHGTCSRHALWAREKTVLVQRHRIEETVDNKR